MPYGLQGGKPCTNSISSTRLSFRLAPQIGSAATLDHHSDILEPARHDGSNSDKPACNRAPARIASQREA